MNNSKKFILAIFVCFTIALLNIIFSIKNIGTRNYLETNAFLVSTETKTESRRKNGRTIYETIYVNTYEYEVDGNKYTYKSESKSKNNKSKITIKYSPEDPSNSVKPGALTSYILTAIFSLGVGILIIFILRKQNNKTENNIFLKVFNFNKFI